MDCLFCDIIAGKIPSHKVAEDEHAFAFLDIHPLTKGHCLVIPKKHSEDIFDIPEEDLHAGASMAKSLAEKCKKNLGATAVQLVNASGKDAEQSVFHFHLHVIPRYTNDGLEMNKWWQGKTREMSQKELVSLAKNLKT